MKKKQLFKVVTSLFLVSQLSLISNIVVMAEPLNFDKSVSSSIFSNEAKMYDFEADLVNEPPKDVTIHTGKGVVINEGGNKVFRAIELTSSEEDKQVSFVADYTKFESSEYQQVSWKATREGAGSRSGFTLRAQDSITAGTSYNSKTKGGYLFQVNDSDVRIYLLGENVNAGKNLSTISLQAPEVGVVRYYRATTKGNTLSFEYSDNGSDWGILSRIKDDTYKEGTVQYVEGFGALSGKLVSIDNVTFANNVAIYFDSNIGSTDQKAIVAEVGEEIDLSKLKPAVKENYEFLGWYKGDSKVEDVIKMPELSVTLVAKWRSITPYEYRYDFESDVLGKEPANINVVEGKGKTIDDIKDSKSFRAAELTSSEKNKQFSFVANYTKFETSGYQQVSWKSTQVGTGSRSGFTLRAQDSITAGNSYTSKTKGGYLFQVNDSDVRIYLLGENVNAGKNLSTEKLKAPELGIARWYRATSSNDNLVFEYSEDGIIWKMLSQVKDITYKEGTVQYVEGFGAQSGNLVSIDDVTYGIAPRIYFNTDGGTTTQKLFVGKSGEQIDLSNLEPAVKEGFTFLGWYDGDTKVGNSITMPLTGVTLTAKWEKNSLLGDINGDGKISLTDYAMLQLYLQKGKLPEGITEEEFIGRADLNEDGKVTLADYAKLQILLSKQ